MFLWVPLVLSCLERKLADCEILMTGSGTANQAAKQLTQAQTGIKSQVWGDGKNNSYKAKMAGLLLFKCLLYYCIVAYLSGISYLA